jgi:hypothetical protein
VKTEECISNSHGLRRAVLDHAWLLMGDAVLNSEGTASLILHSRCMHRIIYVAICLAAMPLACTPLIWDANDVLISMLNSPRITMLSSAAAICRCCRSPRKLAIVLGLRWTYNRYLQRRSLTS